MPEIKTLVKDIYARLDSTAPFDEQDVLEFGHNLAAKLAFRLAEERGPAKLRLSSWDAPCERQTYYKINYPHLVEDLPPNVRLKFLIGDISEEVILFLAKAAGHEVTGEQDTLEFAGVTGHRDGIIDGHLVDTKSASPYGFQKFEEHRLPEDDAFGYMGQLGSYLASSRDDPRLRDKEDASFLAIDKVSGKLALDTYRFLERPEELRGRIEQKKRMLSQPTPPPRGFEPVAMGKAGNMKLGTACSYCPVKAACYPDLRAFAYASGPVWLVTVKELPKVPEIPVYGQERESQMVAD